MKIQGLNRVSNGQKWMRVPTSSQKPILEQDGIKRGNNIIGKF